MKPVSTARPVSAGVSIVRQQTYDACSSLKEVHATKNAQTSIDLAFTRIIRGVLRATVTQARVVQVEGDEGSDDGK
jgi:hypothetical protein